MEFGFIIVFIIFIIAIINRIKFYHPYEYEIDAETLGKIGENMVIRELGPNVEGVQYTVNNILLSDEKGTTAQIDHVHINQYGIFVIETKNYHGKIYGNPKNSEWKYYTRTYRTYRGRRGRKYRRSLSHEYFFYNPLMQNQTHINALRRATNISIPMYSVVVFIDADISNVYSNNVTLIDYLYEGVNTPTGTMLSQDQIKNTYETILRAKNDSTVSEEEHITRLQNKYRD